MNVEHLQCIRKFILEYLDCYSKRELSITKFISDDFIGLDGTSCKIYNKESWIAALKHDFTEVDPFKITIADFDVRINADGAITVAVISSWWLSMFESAPEFDKMRTIFLLRPEGKSFTITHISNSISLIPINREDIFPKQLLKILKHSRDVSMIDTKTNII